jgi:hypothetical protein
MKCLRFWVCQPRVDLWSIIAVCSYKWHQQLKWRIKWKVRSRNLAMTPFFAHFPLLFKGQGTSKTRIRWPKTKMTFCKLNWFDLGFKKDSKLWFALLNFTAYQHANKVLKNNL